jgi:hypothetical protein
MWEAAATAEAQPRSVVQFEDRNANGGGSQRHEGAHRLLHSSASPVNDSRHCVAKILVRHSPTDVRSFEFRIDVFQSTDISAGRIIIQEKRNIQWWTIVWGHKILNQVYRLFTENRRKEHFCISNMSGTRTQREICSCQTHRL